MTVKVTLYAAATAGHKTNRRLLGWLSVGFCYTSLLVGNGKDTAFGTVMAWVYALGALYCFLRWVGEASAQGKLSRGLSEAPPHGVLPPPSEQDESLVQSYGRVLLRYAEVSLAPVSKLPSSKAAIKRALAKGIQHMESPSDRLVLEESYLRLSIFQPLPRGCRDLATVASAEEYPEIHLELACIRDAGAYPRWREARG